MSAKAVLLFDVDGTLLITGGATTRSIWRAAEATFGKPLHRFPLTAGLLDPELFLCIARHNRIADAEWALEAYAGRYLVELEKELDATRDRIKVMPGVETLLENLQDSPRVTTGILTGNFRRATELKLKASGLDRFPFPASAFAEDAPTRSRLIAAALQRLKRTTGHSATPAQCIIIGDTPRDIAAARSAGCRVLSVSTGSYTHEQLRAEHPDAAAENLLDPRPLFDLIDRITCSP